VVRKKTPGRARETQANGAQQFMLIDEDDKGETLILSESFGFHKIKSRRIFSGF